MLGALVGFLVAGTPAPTDPVAVVTVEVRPTGVDLPVGSEERGDLLDLERVAVQLRSVDVLEQAAEAAGLEVEPATLADATTVEPGDGPTLDVTVRLADPADAATAAGAIVTAWLEREAAAATAERDDRLAELERDRDLALRELSALAARAAEDGDEAEQAAFTAQRDAAATRVEQLEAAILDTRAHAVDPGAVVLPVRVVSQQAAGRSFTGLWFGALTGLLLGLVAALVAGRLDRRVWDLGDVARAVGSSAVAHVPTSDLTGDGLRTGPGHRTLAAVVAPAGTTATAVLVTGTQADHGAGVAAGLATAVAATGRRTILLDAGGADAFGLPGGDLDRWLAGGVGLDRVAHSPQGVPNLQVVHARPSRSLPGSATLRELLSAPSAVVVLHVPGAGDAADPLELADLVDRVVLVAAARVDQAEEVARGVRWLGRASTHEPVVVLAG